MSRYTVNFSSMMIRDSHMRFLSAVTSVLFLGLISGCSDSGFESVKGVVTLDGDPVADATVGFLPKDGKVGRPAFGVTKSDGTYELSTLTAGDGAVAADYHVTITAVDIIQSEKAKKLAEKFGSLAGDMPQPKPKETWRVPKTYSEAESSNLEFTVEDGRNTADWTLKK